MKKVAHIYASNAKTNSGDFMLGISTKKYFSDVILKEPCQFKDFDCRNPNLYTPEQISSFNEFDYILVGGGGLILPDSSPNMTSCWQWVIPEKSYDLITKPIYVVSIGYNLFYGQDMSMPKRESNYSEPNRINIFKSNIRKLINKAEHFTLRHTGDMESLISIIGEDMRSKMSMEFCPSIWYVKKYWKPKFKLDQSKKVLAIEIKDDREWRRYNKIGKTKYYEVLLDFVKEYQKKYGLNSIVYMSHDGSANFHRYLISKGVKISILSNASKNEEMIKNNYEKIHTLLCSAGHSQMMAHGLGIKTISMVSHPKLKYFCEDTNNKRYIEVNEEKDIFNKMKSFI